MGVKPEEIARAIAGGNKVLAQLQKVCPRPDDFAAGNSVKPREVVGLEVAKAPDLAGRSIRDKAHQATGTIPRRIRQNTKPCSNKLETDYGNWLKAGFPNNAIWEQAITFRLANGVRYTPDWVILSESGLCCYEIKGKRSWDDAIVKIKVAASVYPQFSWYLCDKPGLSWREQEILP